MYDKTVHAGARLPGDACFKHIDPLFDAYHLKIKGKNMHVFAAAALESESQSQGVKSLTYSKYNSLKNDVAKAKELKRLIPRYIENAKVNKSDYLMDLMKKQKKVCAEMETLKTDLMHCEQMIAAATKSISTGGTSRYQTRLTT